MAKSVKAGDRVSWNSSGGKSTGNVEKKLTRTTHIKGHTAKPDKNHPQYLVRSKKSGKVAAHKASELRKGS